MTELDVGSEVSEETQKRDQPTSPDVLIDSGQGFDLSNDLSEDSMTVDASSDGMDERGKVDGGIDVHENGRDAALDVSPRHDGDANAEAGASRDVNIGDIWDSAVSPEITLDVLPIRDPIYASAPVLVAHIMAGQNMFLATARDGALWGWGDNWGGLFQPADVESDFETRTRPQRIDGVMNVREFQSTGGAGLCILAGIPPEGSLYCWGRSSYRMYGYYGGDRWDAWRYPVRMDPTVSDILSLGQSGVVVRSDLSLWRFGGHHGTTWMRYPQHAGQTLDYEEGINLLPGGVLSDYESSSDTPPSRYRCAPGLQRLSGVVELSARNEHACMRTDDGRVLCWGLNEWGAAGNFDLGGQCGTEGARWGHCVMVPTEIPGIRDAVKVVTGDYQTCAIRRDGTLWCWGANDALADGRGSIGDGRLVDETCGDSLSGTVRCRRRPVQVVGLRDVVDVAIATSAACALVAGGQVYCWGYNHGGMLAVGTTTDVPLPLPIRW